MSGNNLSLAFVLKMVNEAAAPMRSAVQDFLDLGAAANSAASVLGGVSSASSAAAGAIGTTAAAATSATEAVTGATEAAGGLPSALDAIGESATSSTEAIEALNETAGAVAPAAESAADAVEGLNDATEATSDATDSAADQTRQYDSALDRVRHGVGQFLRQRLPHYWQNIKMATAAAATAVVAASAAVFGAVSAGTMWVKQKAEETALLVKAASAVGLATQSYQRMEYAFKSVNVTGGEMDKLLTDLATKATLAAAGGKEQGRAFKDLGVRLTEDGRKMKKTDVLLADIADKFAKLPDGTKKAAIAQMLFGDAGARLIPLLNQGSAGLKALGDEASKLGLVLDGKTIQKSAELADMWDKMQSSVAGLKNIIFTGLLPSVVELTTWLGKLLEKNRDDIVKGIETGIQALKENLPPILKGLGEFWKFLSDIAAIGASVVGAVGGLSNALDIMAAVMIGNLAMGLRTAIGSVITLNAAFWACPVTWIVAGIAAVAVGAYLLIRHWDKVSAFFGGLWDGIKSVFNSAVNWISDNFAKLPLPLKLLAAPLMIIKHWDTIKAFFGGLWEKISGVWKGLPVWMQTIISLPLTIITHWDAIVGWFKGMGQKVGAAWDGLPPWAQALLNLPMAIISHWDEVAPMVTGVWQTIQKGWNDAATWFGNIFEAINTTIQSAVDRLWQSFPDWFKDLLRGAGKVWQFIFGGDDPTAGLPPNGPVLLPPPPPPAPAGKPVALTSRDFQGDPRGMPDLNGSLTVKIESDRPTRLAGMSTGKGFDVDVEHLGVQGPRRS